jgi:hypothetical protein
VTPDLDPPRDSPYTVRRCLLCGHTPIDARVDGRFVTTTCTACQATLMIEFDPPDQPGLRASIERIDDSNETRRRANAATDEVCACDRDTRTRRTTGT